MNAEATRITDILPQEVTFAVYRYRHLYVVQGQDVLVLDKQRNLTHLKLNFAPSTWASYAGHFALYDPAHGVAALTGAEVLAEQTGSGPFAAPLGNPLSGGVGLVMPAQLPGPDVNGLPYQSYGQVVRVDVLDRSFYSRLTGALVEPGRVLAFTGQTEGFSFLNGVQGNLLYGDAPELTVPYAYGAQGLFGAGTPDGYVFTPDMGRSWRVRHLGGFGVLTESAVVRVNPVQGVEVVVGTW